MASINDEKNYLDVQVGTFEFSFNKKYRFIALSNDIVLGIFFLVGSVFFLFEPLKTAGAVLFIIGSAQLLARPILKIFHAIYFTRRNRS
ncbi:YrhK-like protein [Lentibacillus persicus]|uniref:YrhK-like protein n=1 Tax=Lentibacillus persicus TaxID=640948 RepID=A0A1I1RVV5_9BACI|nr:YrhK family protein [Lentibacillus persicus]SFD38381.1 YrhK-like protein [Lentibacillus persicus]